MASFIRKNAKDNGGDDLSAVYDDDLYAKRRISKTRLILLLIVAAVVVGAGFWCFDFFTKQSPIQAAVSFINNPNSRAKIDTTLRKYGFTVDQLDNHRVEMIDVAWCTQIESVPLSQSQALKRYVVAVRVFFKTGQNRSEAGAISLLLRESGFNTGKYSLSEVEIRDIEPPESMRQR